MSLRTKTAGVWLVLLLVPTVVLAVGFVGFLAAVSSAASEDTGSGDVRSSCLPAGVAQVDAAEFTPTQVSNAAVIVSVGKRMGVPPEGWVIAVATAIQESGLRNLHRGDLDSLGLFQQRPSAGWGTPEQITNPTYAATQFYEHLLALPNWRQMSLTEAAQAVQRSAFPRAYADHKQEARYLVGVVLDSRCVSDTSSGAWVVPVDGQCTSGFGYRNGELHGGLDIAAPIGATIVAAHAGTVIDAGPARGYGLWVRIRHPNGTVTTYGHNHRNLVEVGETVQAGQPIAKVGSRGNSTGPHVHFEIHVDGEAVAPARFYEENGAPPLC